MKVDLGWMNKMGVEGLRDDDVVVVWGWGWLSE